MEFGSQFFFVPKSKEDDSTLEHVEENVVVEPTTSPATTAATVPAPVGRLNPWSSQKEIKVVVMGAGGVGKSSICIRYVQDHFVGDYDPTIEDSYRKLLKIDDKDVILDLLDTAGQEEYSAMRDMYVRTGQAFFMVYSIDSRSSLDEVQPMVEQIRRIKDDDHVPLMIVGNKADKDDSSRHVSTAEGAELAARLGVHFAEVSAKTRLNIDSAFTELVRLVWSQRQAPPPSEAQKKGGFFSRLFGGFSKSPSTQSPTTTMVPHADPIAVAEPPKTKTVKTKFQAVSTNVAALSLGDLAIESEKPAEAMTGECKMCAKCGAAMCSLCELIRKGVVVAGWKCAFCGASNTEDDGEIDEHEIPQTDKCDYILEAAGAADGGAAAAGAEEGLVVFCLDVSGSMGATSQVPEMQAKWLEVRGSTNKDKFVSRIQCTKAAVKSHIDRLVRLSPQKRVVLLTFNNVVTRYEDDSKTTVYSDTILESFDKMLEAGASYDVGSLAPVAVAHTRLHSFVDAIDESGSTALGPALTLALGMCERAKQRRCEIVLMTDGLANMGFGCLPGVNSSMHAESVKLYNDIGERALSQRTTINIIGLESEDSAQGRRTDGTRCDVALDVLGACAVATHGTVTIVNPFELLRQIRTIYQNPVVATDVRIAVAVPPYVTLTGPDAPQLSHAPVSASASSSASAGTDTTEKSFSKTVTALLNKMKKEAIAQEDFDVAKALQNDLAIAKKMVSAELGGNARKVKHYFMKLTTELPPAIHEMLQAAESAEKPTPDKKKKKVSSKVEELPSITVGSALADMDTTFEFAARTDLVDPPCAVPVQFHIYHTRPDGTEVLRVLTKQLQVTGNRAAAHESANVAVVGLHALHSMASYGLTHEWQACYDSVHNAVLTANTIAITPVQKEEAYSLRTEFDKLGETLLRATAGDTRVACSDATARLLYQAKGATLNLLLAGKLKTAAVKRRKVNESLQEHVQAFAV